MKPLETFADSEGRTCQLLCRVVSDETGEMLLVYQRLEEPGVLRAMRADALDDEADTESAPEEEAGKTVSEESAAPEEDAANAAEAAPDDADSADTAGEEEAELDPDVARFLDATSMEEKMDVLLSMRDHIRNDQIDTLAMSLGISIDEGSPEERFDDLRECLNTIARYELENARLR
ncbi:MAG: hypothetical protein ACI4OJ_04065 [Lachnospiraceae bacterium]